MCVSEAHARAAHQALVTRHLTEHRALAQDAQRHGLSSVFHQQANTDPQQALVLNDKGLPHSQAQLIAQPALVLDHVPRTKSSFKRPDVLRALAQRIEDPLTLQNTVDRAFQPSELVRLPHDGAQPVFTTRDYRNAECTLDHAARIMSAKNGYGVAADPWPLQFLHRTRRCTELFGGTLSAEQKAALCHMLGKKRLSFVIGLAGAGKSTLLATARDAWTRQGFKVHGAALAGKAAEGLNSASGIKSRTLASLEMSWENGHDPISKEDVLVIDEAGMIGTRQLARVCTQAAPILLQTEFLPSSIGLTV